MGQAHAWGGCNCCFCCHGQARLEHDGKLETDRRPRWCWLLLGSWERQDQRYLARSPQSLSPSSAGPWTGPRSDSPRPALPCSTGCCCGRCSVSIQLCFLRPWSVPYEAGELAGNGGPGFTVPVPLFTMPYFFNELCKCLRVRTKSGPPAAPSPTRLTLCVPGESFLRAVVVAVVASVWPLPGSA